MVSARRWARETWLDGQIEAGLASGAAWRIARGLVLQGMLGRDPQEPEAPGPDLAPAWLREVGVAAFRYQRRAIRMRAWSRLVIETDSPARAEAASRVLAADADRRFHKVIADLESPPSRMALLEGVSEMIAARDSHAAGMGLLQFVLGIHSHPWLGPPGLPDSHFQ